MQIGRLRHRVIIQTREATLGSRGQASTTWQDVDTVWASVETLSGRELEVAKRQHAEATHRVRMRYHSAVREEVRLKFGSRYLHVQAVDNPEQRNAELVLTCGEARN